MEKRQKSSIIVAFVVLVLFVCLRKLNLKSKIEASTFEKWPRSVLLLNRCLLTQIFKLSSGFFNSSVLLKKIIMRTVLKRFQVDVDLLKIFQLKLQELTNCMTVFVISDVWKGYKVATLEWIAFYFLSATLLSKENDSRKPEKWFDRGSFHRFCVFKFACISVFRKKLMFFGTLWQQGVLF